VSTNAKYDRYELVRHAHLGSVAVRIGNIKDKFGAIIPSNGNYGMNAKSTNELKAGTRTSQYVELLTRKLDSYAFKDGYTLNWHAGMSFFYLT
jgi:hypothetical protein